MSGAHGICHAPELSFVDDWQVVSAQTSQAILALRATEDFARRWDLRVDSSKAMALFQNDGVEFDEPGESRVEGSRLGRGAQLQRLGWPPFNSYATGQLYSRHSLQELAGSTAEVAIVPGAVRAEASCTVGCSLAAGSAWSIYGPK